MSAETLLFYAMIFVAIAAICSVICLVHRKLRPDDVTLKIAERHAGKSILSPDHILKTSAVVWLGFIAIAFTSDPAYTWLAAAAVMAFFIALLVDRICASAMGRHPKMFLPKFARTIPIARFRKKKEKDDSLSQQDTEEIEIVTQGEDFEERRDEQEPEALEPAIVNIVFLLATIIAIAAFVDVFVLLGMEFIEVVVPHYLGMIGG